jgi:LacI family transcriptional regulator
MAGVNVRRSAVTIADVANAAGVSRATVSRVMNGRRTVDPEITARVQEAAIELNYRPSNVARSLSIGRTTTVALVVPDLGNPVFQEILRGVTAAAGTDGYRVLVADTAEDPAQEAVIALDARRRCDALVLVSPRMPAAELDALLADVEPAVVINREVGHPDVPSLVVDYADAATQIVEHLVELGHRHLMYLGGPRSAATDVARRGALDAARRRHPGLEITAVEVGSTVAAGHAAAGAVLASRATAVVAFNDLVAFGLLAALNEAGVAVPKDVSVAGFDDIELARYATPGLTTAAVPQDELGRHAWRELHAVVDGGAPPATATRFGARLQVRSSTGPVPRQVARAQVVEPPAPGGAADAEQAPTWSAEGPDGATVVLRRSRDQVPLARYVDGSRLPTIHSPRPYLHPVHSLAGQALTDSEPVDHRHQYGVGVALPDVNGTSYWGGRTFVAGAGPTLLANHGRQVSTGVTIDPTAPHLLVDTLEWRDEHGAPQLDERRSIGARLLDDDGWVLEWRTTLHATHGPLELRSPATNGRPGAGYGGVFWRLPVAADTLVLSAAGPGEEAAHGSTSPWVAFVQHHRDRDGERTTTTLLTQTSPVRHWFLRAADYPGACPALVWDTPLTVPAGGTVETGVVAALLDRELDLDEAAHLATELR